MDVWIEQLRRTLKGCANDQYASAKIALKSNKFAISTIQNQGSRQDHSSQPTHTDSGTSVL